ncbi:acetylornithine deacetylase [Roseovarius sp.]|uniref:acetylornithine deacetylase n=1 Tax=Roseovarius sp. TaxID=1486281 RepID=UPI0026188454|nr:acetylornithine deacetylase [Roseovarius sp.]
MGRPATPRAILDALVGFPTVSRDSNLELIDWVEDYLAQFGVKSTRVYNDEGNKAALYASVGPDVEGGVVLSGHTDVVPVDGQDWSTDPFTVVEKNGRLYGRGTCDMKGFDALALAAVPLALERGIKRPLQIALSYDEEVGCIGAPPMIDRMVRDAGLPRAGAVIVGEPSMMKVVSGHKGGTGFKLHFRGFEVHSSLMHTGVNAIMYGAKIIEWANQMNARNMARQPRPSDAIFEPPWTTVHVGTIHGGTAHNITAKDCHFGLDFRFVPGDDISEWEALMRARLAEIEAEMKAIHPSASIGIERYFSVPALKPEVDGPAEALVRRLTGRNTTEVVSYGTEAGQFQERDYSAIICGPGNIAQAHQPDEYLTVEQFEAGQAFMDGLIETLRA